MNPDDIAGRVGDEAPEALIVTTPDGRVSYWNRAAEALFGYSRAEALGRRLDDLVLPPPDASAGTPATPEDESVRRRKDGTLIYVHAAMRELVGPAGEVQGRVHSNADGPRRGCAATPA